MRQWIVALAGMVLSACAAPYGGPMSVSSGYGPASPYAYGGVSPYGHFASPYGLYTGYAGASRFSPKKGLTCDRARNICYDRYGADYFETQKYLGSKSAKRGVKRYGEQVYIFAPEQGVMCDRRSQSCSDGDGLNASLTRKYFSKDDTRRVAGWTGAELFAPQAGVACSRTTQVCSDSSGPNVNLTELYLGRAAALNLANQQNPAVPVNAAAPDNSAPDDSAPDKNADGIAVPASGPEAVDPVFAAQPDAPVPPIEGQLVPDPVSLPQVIPPVPEPVSEPPAVAEPQSGPEPVLMAAPEPQPAMTSAPEPASQPAPAPAAICEGDACP